ncbi:CoA transferase [Alicyclobacillaceae bacterium I2511]|nr:CoA transferase [Alicyclobacillaceae bacterium I2511]
MEALAGIKVVDFTRILAGPFCTMNLADLGAEVYKVESPQEGDDTRKWGPPFLHGESAYYLCVNRNKRSLTLDLKSTMGQLIAKQLISQADVVVHNFLPHSAQKLGLTYKQVKAVKQDVVYCGISGYGQESNRPGYDYILQATGGLMSITGNPQGPPMKVGVAITDLFTGLYATTAIITALFHRQRTGVGQAIDMALYDAQIAMLANVASNVLVSKQDAVRLGNGHPNIVPYQLFHTKDGDVVLTVGNDRQFQSLCKQLNLENLAQDPRYLTNASRVKHRDQLIPILQARFLDLTQAEVLQRIAAAHVPAGPIRTVGQALNDPLTAARDMVWEVPHPLLGDLRLVASPLKLAGTPPTYRLPPPRLGEHTREVLIKLGYNDEKIDEWMKTKVIGEC